MIAHLGFAAGVLIAALAMALLEVQIEGGNGWASALPTWKVESAWARRAHVAS